MGAGNTPTTDPFIEKKGGDIEKTKEQIAQ